LVGLLKGPAQNRNAAGGLEGTPTTTD
jgi:hypothetical protein